MLEYNKFLTSNSLTSLPAPRLWQAGNFLTSILFYLSILIFIISFNFSDAPTPSGWYQQWMPTPTGGQIRDIFFVDSLLGFAVSDSSILKTTNGGNNWTTKFNGYYIFKRVQFINSSTGFARGYNLWKSTNSGENWLPVNSPGPGEDMYVLNNDTIWTVYSEALTGGVFRTTNGGGSWVQQLALGSSNPDHIYMFNGRIGFICETNNYIRKTTNSGLNWDTVVNGESFTDMYFTDSLIGWRSFGTMKKTTDGGISWINQVMPSGGYIINNAVEKFTNLNSDTLWAVGGIYNIGSWVRGIINRTTNGGNNWLFQVPDTNINIFKYYHTKFVNRFNGWAYAPSTGIHTTTGGDTIFYTPVKQISSNMPGEFKLFQNYPNPFNPITKIKFSLPSPSQGGVNDVKLMVFDILGHEVASLIPLRQLAEGKEGLQAGEYEINFDGTNYPSGVYFYSMYADGKLIDTKKMILIK